MSDILGTTLSGLLAFQRSLATTGNNIANANTEGYSRQRVNLTALPGQNIGGATIGNGVTVNSVDRVLDGFQVAEVRGNLTQQGRLEVFSELSRDVDSLLGSSETGLSPALLGFFEGVQAAADDPSSTAARQSLISQAEVLAGRFASLDARLEAQNDTINDRITASLPEINALSEAIAEINIGIAEASSVSGGVPNDLLDQRDLLLSDLSEKLSVDVVTQSDGSLNVFIGSGQALVLGGEAASLRFGNGEFGGDSPEIFLDSFAGTSLITNTLSGGEIGGLLDAGRELINPSRNQLGQLSLGLAKLANEVQAGGLNLRGELGSDLFSVGEPQSFESAANTGGAALSLEIADVGELTASDYQFLVNDGTAQLIRLDTQTVVPLSGGGTSADPYVADGIEIVVNGTPADGDAFLLRPTSGLASDFSVAISNPVDLALASAVSATTELANAGSVSVDSLEVVDAQDTSLLNTVAIEFLSDTTYSVDGSGSFDYSPDVPIEINGWRLDLNGTPSAGDRLEVGENSGGVGDNRNALALGEVLDQGVFEDGSLSVQGSYAVLLSNVSTGTAQAEIRLEAQTSITEQSVSDLQSNSGVNLDEEAANIVRFQQAYQAAAQLLGVADTLFQTLLGAVRR